MLRCCIKLLIPAPRKNCVKSWTVVYPSEMQLRCCKERKLDQPVLRAGVMDSVADTALDMFVHHRLPWMGKKVVEMWRYYGSEALRNKLQKKAIDYALDKLNPMIQNVGSQALDQLSTKTRPKKNYKTNRKDLDGAGLLDSALTSGVFGSPFHVDYKKGLELLTAPDLFKTPTKQEKADMKERVTRGPILNMPENRDGQQNHLLHSQDLEVE